MKVVLSHPFSGALFWWLAAQSGVGGDQASKRPSHGYYRTLYGDVDRNLDIALACAVIFEEVVLPGADAPYPEFVRTSDDALRLPALEIVSDWAIVAEAMRLLEPIEAELVNDLVIRRIFGRIPRGAQSQALLYATADVLLTQMHRAPVLCAAGRRQVVLRLIELGVAPVADDVAVAIQKSGGLIEGLGSYADIVSLRFKSETIGSLADVKWNGKIRRYAEGFQRALIRGIGADSDQFFEDLASAWESADLAGAIAGAFSATSSIMGPAALIPGVGTVAGAIGLGSDAAGRTAERRSENFRWYQLGPEIQKYESLRALERALTERGLRL